jgi:hypothetical protein
VAVDEPQQLVGGKRDVVATGLPVMQSALGDVQKLRTLGPGQSEAKVHLAQALPKLGAGVRVETALLGPLLYFIRCILC